MLTWSNRITCTATIAHPDEIIADASVGQLAPNMEAKLMEDDEVTEAPPGGRGEVWIKGPNVMKGYWNKPDATKGTFSADGWLKTGDIAHVDERGHFYIVDRKKVKRYFHTKSIEAIALEEHWS